MDEENFRVDSTAMYASLKTTTYTSRYDTRSSRHAYRAPSWTTVAQQRVEWNMCWGSAQLLKTNRPTIQVSK
ncbi:hypothetical protein KIN20_004045 [Parelaphostrongylus tenuis]|uniref:Uncharacterized protein n=1 Tax=Parelaphostrongylus tenuis TaxID=148309 RepID=A0AAD5MJ66_PARTN|nr:hypothetical protein KIN20_004045 [Parelaphostrongylus tenuis]